LTIVKDKDYMQSVIDQSGQIVDAAIKAAESMIGSTGIGMSAPNDEMLAAFFFKQMKMEPPETFILPDGRQVHISPWVLALGYAEGGREWLDRFNGFMQKHRNDATSNVAGGV
jgi:hypothetical protein